MKIDFQLNMCEMKCDERLQMESIEICFDFFFVAFFEKSCRFDVVYSMFTLLRTAVTDTFR